MMNNKEIFKQYTGHTATVADDVILKMLDMARGDERSMIAEHNAHVKNQPNFALVEARNKAGSEMDERWCPHKKDICNR